MEYQFELTLRSDERFFFPENSAVNFTSLNLKKEQLPRTYEVALKDISYMAEHFEKVFFKKPEDGAVKVVFETVLKKTLTVAKAIDGLERFLGFFNTRSTAEKFNVELPFKAKTGEDGVVRYRVTLANKSLFTVALEEDFATALGFDSNEFPVGNIEAARDASQQLFNEIGMDRDLQILQLLVVNDIATIVAEPAKFDMRHLVNQFNLALFRSDIVLNYPELKLYNNSEAEADITFSETLGHIFKQRNIKIAGKNWIQLKPNWDLITPNPRLLVLCDVIEPTAYACGKQLPVLKTLPPIVDNERKFMSFTSGLEFFRVKQFSIPLITIEIVDSDGNPATLSNERVEMTLLFRPQPRAGFRWAVIED